MLLSGSSSVTTPTSVSRWTSGTYTYDGAGNVKAIGTHTFTYDKVSRLTAANLYLEPTASTTLRTQTFGYDAFGNLLTFGGSSARNTPTAPGTNHLTGATYDASGNVITWNGNAYTYDPFHLMWDYKTPSDEWIYLYTADDERAWSYKTDNTSLWTLRGLDAKVLREYTTNGTWSVAEDYIYRDGLLLAAETPAGTRHFHLDHLGTPRLVSNNLGQQAAYHVYYPFGEEATAFNQDTIRAKFTGHERDLGNPGGSGDDLDYMHARFCSPLTGRFFGFDLGKVTIEQPQSWNRYAYTLNNPLHYINPDGHASEEPGLYERLRQAFLNTFNRFFPPGPVKTDPSAQGLVEEGELTQAQAARLSPGAEANLAQNGLNEAGSALAAGAIFTGLKAGEVAGFAEVVSGYSVGGSVVLKGGELQVNVSMLGKLEGGGGTLKGLFSAFEREATRQGASQLVVEGRLARALFSSEKAVRAFAKLGYAFQKLADGTIVLSKTL